MKNVIFKHKILVFVSVIILVAQTYSFDPCSEQFEVVTDFGLDDCGEDFFQLTGNQMHSCFPYCAEKWDLEKPNGKPAYCNPKKCPPGYKCSEPLSPGDDKLVCEIDEASCFKYYGGSEKTNPWKRALWKPECLQDGTWAPKQCKPDSVNGRCFCFNAFGNRIFGHEFANKATNMTCACSLRRVELVNSGSRFYATLHCDSMGNYEPLQCDSGQCWCVEPMTGEITAKVVPEKMMSYLPCYSKENVGEQYLRQCESEEYAKEFIVHELNTHGTKYTNFPHVLCDADGTYGPFQIKGGQATCTWKDKSSLTYSSSEDIHKMNCNCARDKKIYELQGSQQNLMCSSNGNYEPIQKTKDGKKKYCVDSDGVRKSDDVETVPDGGCAIFYQ